MSNEMEQLARHRLVPVVVLEDAADAAPLGRALLAGGLPVAEVTFRTAAAAEAIEQMAAIDELLVGAGTVVNVEQAQRAVKAGARFIVSPGLSADVVQWCQDAAVPVIPGVWTPTELMAAMALGLEVVKFFPAEAAGGLATLKALAGPFPAMRFMPTGGVGPGNLTDYLAVKAVLACGGSWMVKKNHIRAKDFQLITDLTRQAVATASNR